MLANGDVGGSEAGSPQSIKTRWRTTTCQWKVDCCWISRPCLDGVKTDDQLCHICWSVVVGWRRVGCWWWGGAGSGKSSSIGLFTGSKAGSRSMNRRITMSNRIDATIAEDPGSKRLNPFKGSSYPVRGVRGINQASFWAEERNDRGLIQRFPWIFWSDRVNMNDEWEGEIRCRVKG